MWLPLLFLLLDCRHPDNTADMAVCTVPELRALDQQIEQQSAVLKSKLDAGNLGLLSDTGMPFLRELNNCSNESDVSACVKKVVTERLNLLTRSASDPKALREGIAQAKFIDIGFLWKYWPQLVGRKLAVSGCLMPDDNEKTQAVLETENQPPAPIVFKSMPQEIADFLDDQKPCGDWAVTVLKRGDKFVLHADEVLGRPLP